MYYGILCAPRINCTVVSAVCCTHCMLHVSALLAGGKWQAEQVFGGARFRTRKYIQHRPNDRKWRLSPALVGNMHILMTTLFRIPEARV